MGEFIRKINYHETDKMGVTHHSNYIKFMEEARIYFLDEIGFSYARLESEGVMSPVIGVECKYFKPTTFNDEIKVKVELNEYSGARLAISYEMTNIKTGDLVLKGTTRHCFVSKNLVPVALKKVLPEFDAILKSMINEQDK